MEPDENSTTYADSRYIIILTVASTNSGVSTVSTKWGVVFFFGKYMQLHLIALKEVFYMDYWQAWTLLLYVDTATLGHLMSVVCC